MSVRNLISMLEAENDLLHIDRSVHWVDEAPAIGAEGARQNGSALLFENVPGKTRLVSGLYGGPDQLLPRNRTPWSRLAMGVGLDSEIPYNQFARQLTRTPPNNSRPNPKSIKAKPVGVDLYSLGFPTLSDEAPTITLGLCAVTISEKTVWAPIHACVKTHDSLVASIPAALGKQLSPDTNVTIALGVPTACLIAAELSWMGETKTGDSLAMAQSYSDIAFADEQGGFIPASAEGVISGTVGEMTDHHLHPREGWEKATETITLKIRVTDLALRENAIIPFSPLGAPLADDIHLASVVESVRLLRRLNNYWGVSPVEWIHLPAETHLGMCLVATEILYAGFEWQLANTLFSFSRLFDKVLILDEDTPPGDLAKAFDDMWIKAHPSHDWHFSEPEAPAATATEYRSDGTTGSRLFIDATWDPRWDDEFIAPQVDFESSYPEDIRAFVLDNWDTMGFSTGPGEL